MGGSCGDVAAAQGKLDLVNVRMLCQRTEAGLCVLCVVPCLLIFAIARECE